MIRFIVLFLLLLSLSLKAEAPSSEKELQLLLQVFTYSEDLENAYKVAKEGATRYPRSLYWHQKLAQVAQWTDRREEAIQEYMYVYKRTRDSELQEKILEYSLSAYQYKAAAILIEDKVKVNSSEENVKKFIFIFDRVGRPAYSAKVLEELYIKDPKRENLLYEALNIYLNLGEMDEAKRVVNVIEKADIREYQTLILVSHYYFLRRETYQAFATLQRIDKKQLDENAVEYYKQLSDLAWFLQEFKKGADASIEVDKLHEARLVDYERIMAVYKGEAIALQAALDGYKKFKNTYLFYSYAYLALDNKAYNDLKVLMNEIESSESTLPQEALYWVIKAQVFTALKKYDNADRAFEMAISMDGDSISIMESYMWFLIDTKRESTLRKFLARLEKRDNLDVKFWMVMALAYNTVQEDDRALFYIRKLHVLGYKEINIELLYAYILLGQNEEGAFYTQMRMLDQRLRNELKDNPTLIHDEEFLQNYLTVRRFLIGIDQFHEELEKYKPSLSTQGYNELRLAAASGENIDEKIHFLARRLAKIEPWLALNIASNADDRATQLEILYAHYVTLPKRDSIEAARETGQLALAQTLAFNHHNKNEKDEMLYDALRQVVMDSADAFISRTGYLSRTGMNRVYTENSNSLYMARGYSFETELNYASNSINDNEIFLSIPSSSMAFGIGIKKRFDRGEWRLITGMKDSADSYPYARFNYLHRLGDRTTMNMVTEIGGEAEESVYTLVGGYKDRISVGFDYAILGSSTISVTLEQAQYSSDDGVGLGSGTSGRLAYTYLQRAAYPDITFTPYVSFGQYSESGVSNGVIDDMIVFPDTNVISDDFVYVGFDLTYGMQNRYDYVRVWRPFASVSPYYNSTLGDVNYAFSAGVGGELFGEDNLALVVDYSESVGGTDDTLWRSFFRYKVFY